MDTPSPDVDRPSGRRLNKIIEPAKDKMLTRQLLAFFSVMGGIIVIALLLWFAMTQEHLSQLAEEDTPPSPELSAPAKQVSPKEKQPASIPLFKSPQKEVAMPLEDIFQTQEDEVVLQDLKPEVRKILENNRALKSIPIKPAPRPPTTNKKAAPLQVKEKAATPQKKVLESSKTLLAPTATLIIEGPSLSFAKKITDLFPSAYITLTPKQLGQKSYQAFLKAKRPKLLIDVQMQPLNAAIKLKPGALKVSMTAKDIKQHITRLKTNYPELAGIRNHMGSAFLSNKKSAAALFKSLKAHNLVFVDAVTGPYKIQGAAKQEGITYLKRTDFLNKPARAFQKKVKNPAAVIYVKASNKNLAFLKKHLPRP